MFIDSHCHLDRIDLKDFDNNFDQLMLQAEQAGVGKMLCVCITLEAFEAMAQLTDHYPNVFLSVGVHPSEQGSPEPTVDNLLTMAARSKVVAIGETGLDYHYVKDAPEWQRERFRTHIRAALEIGKPLIVHSRDAREDTIRILKEEGAERVGGVMHCFTEDQAMADHALSLGFAISFSGIVTFKSAAVLREVARNIPDDYLLIETDSPYLAPVPYRGKQNHPALVPHPTTLEPWCDHRSC